MDQQQAMEPFSVPNLPRIPTRASDILISILTLRILSSSQTCLTDGNSCPHISRLIRAWYPVLKSIRLLLIHPSTTPLHQLDLFPYLRPWHTYLDFSLNGEDRLRSKSCRVQHVSIHVVFELPFLCMAVQNRCMIICLTRTL